MESTDPLSELEQKVGRLEGLSDDLITVVDHQIDAVVNSKTEQIEEYVQQYTSLRGVFRDEEQEFINQLRMTLNKGGANKAEVRLESLKECYPQQKDLIADWQDVLEKQMDILKKKQEKLDGLLEFAVEKNMQLMHSIYSMHNKKNTRYSSGGTKEEISSGIALNKEA